MSVVPTSIPTIANAIEFARFLMEKRIGSRTDYSSSTDPTKEEINERLRMSEDVISRLTQKSFRPTKQFIETIWSTYGGSTFGSMYMRRNVYNRLPYPSTVTLLHNPIISVDKMELVYNNEIVDIIDHADFEEGWDKEYYIDYRNGIIEFRRFRVPFRSPVRIEYTAGLLETIDGEPLYSGTVDTVESETRFSTTVDITEGLYNGKLLKITSGDLTGETYRIESVDTLEEEPVGEEDPVEYTSIKVLDGYTIETDGLADGDTFDIYGMPNDIKMMVLIYTYLGLLKVDPTYQHNFTNPFEEATPQYQQYEFLLNELYSMVELRKSSIRLVN